MGSAYKHEKIVVRRINANSSVSTVVPKEEHEITDEDRAFARQMDVDWLWWMFLIGARIKEDIARQLEKHPDKVAAMIDRIIAGEVEITQLRPILDDKPWTPRQDKILLRLKEASCSLKRAAILLSRTFSSVKHRAKTLSTNG